MNIRLEQYKLFYTTAISGSFSEAAKKLFITQSAVSQQIRALENELGVLLFARGRKGATLTPQGKLLFDYAERAMNEFENAETLFARMKTLDEGSLRIGAGDTITRHFLLPRLEKFHSKYPGIKIEIINRVTDETLTKLKSGNIDVAFISMPVDTNAHHSVEIREAGELHDVFIAGNSFSHLKDKTFTIEDIASLPLVMLEPKSNTRKTVDNFFEKHNVILNPEFELGSHDLLFDFAVNNLGIACVTKEFSPKSNNDEYFTIKTDFELPKRSIGICTLKNAELSPAVSKLIEMISNEE